MTDNVTVASLEFDEEADRARTGQHGIARRDGDGASEEATQSLVDHGRCIVEGRHRRDRDPMTLRITHVRLQHLGEADRPRAIQLVELPQTQLMVEIGQRVGDLAWSEDRHCGASAPPV